MQLVAPIDIANCLRLDLAEKLGGRVFCQPFRDDLTQGDVGITTLGGYEQTPVSHAYDVSIDVWGATFEQAMRKAMQVAGLVAALPILNFVSGRHYVTASINATPYENPDPYRPTLPRATFRATVGIRGEAVPLD